MGNFLMNIRDLVVNHPSGIVNSVKAKVKIVRDSSTKGMGSIIHSDSGNVTAIAVSHQSGKIDDMSQQITNKWDEDIVAITGFSSELRMHPASEVIHKLNSVIDSAARSHPERPIVLIEQALNRVIEQGKINLLNHYLRTKSSENRNIHFLATNLPPNCLRNGIPNTIAKQNICFDLADLTTQLNMKKEVNLRGKIFPNQI